MKLNRVVFTKLEGEWFQKNVVRTLQVMEAASKKDPKILERVTYKTLNRIAESDLKITGDTLEVMLSRKQKSVVANMVLQTLIVLENTVIPEYTRRGSTEYLEDVKMKVGLLKTMHRKLQ